MVRQAIRKIEDYFQNHIKNLHLRIQSDPEDYEDYQTLILEVESTESIKKTFELLTSFQKEWLIPNFGSKISHFSIDTLP